MVFYIVISYLIGSIPFAYLWTKLSSGFDIRTVASRNVGTTNVLRNVGVVPGVLTMLGDVFKGVAVGLLSNLCPIRVVQGLMPAVAIAGHNWPVWLRFRGGGGLATFIGGSLVTSNFTGTVIAVIIWGVTFLVIKDHDRSALVACVLAPVVLMFANDLTASSVVFYVSSSLMIALRRIQSMLEKRLPTPPTAKASTA